MLPDGFVTPSVLIRKTLEMGCGGGGCNGTVTALETLETLEMKTFKLEARNGLSMESRFRPENHIFETKDPFREEFTPEEIFEREDVFEKYTHSLQDIVDGFGPPNIFVYGDSGLGKTAVTKKMMEMLRKEVEGTDIDLQIVNINCNKTDTTYGVIRKLANELHPDEHFKQGHHHEHLWERVYERLDEIGGDFLLILDEIDQLGEDDTLLYEFPRARSMGEIDNARVGVIGISNDYLYRENLRDRVKSTLCEDEIEFNPYDANELNTILSYYADLGFKDDVLSGDVVPLCAALTAQETGDARRGLDLLKTAGNIARRENADLVTEAHVNKARHEVERANIKDTFKSGLPLQQQLTLIATAFLVIKTEDNVRRKEIYKMYTNITNKLGKTTVTERRVRSFLGTLCEKGLLESEVNNLGGRGGRWYTYSTVVEPRTVIEAVEETDSELSSLVTSDVRAELEQYEYDHGAQPKQRQARLQSSW